MLARAVVFIPDSLYREVSQVPWFTGSNEAVGEKGTDIWLLHILNQIPYLVTPALLGRCHTWVSSAECRCLLWLFDCDRATTCGRIWGELSPPDLVEASAILLQLILSRSQVRCRRWCVQCHWCHSICFWGLYGTTSALTAILQGVRADPRWSRLHTENVALLSIVKLRSSYKFQDLGFQVKWEFVDA